MYKTEKKSILRRGVSMILMLAVLMFTVPFTMVSGAASTNLFPEGDFEAAALPSTYFAASCYVSQSVFFYQGAGSKSMKVTQTGSYGGVYMPITTLVSGKTYRYAMWAKFDSASTGNVPINLAYRLNGPGGDIAVCGGKSISNTADFTLFDGEFTFNGAGASKVELLIYGNDGPNVFYIDNLQIYEYPGLQENQILNGSFEDTLSIPFTTGGTSLSFVSDNVYSGSSALKVEQLGPWGNLSQRVYVHPGRLYYVNCYSKLLGSGLTTTLAYNLVVGGVDNVFAAGPAMSSEGGFVKSSGLIYIDPSWSTINNAVLSMFAYPANGGAASFVIDDLEFKEVESPKIVSTSPAMDSMVNIDTSADIQFNHDMDESSVSDISNYSLNGSTDNIASITMPTASSCKITFKNLLAENMTYTLNIGAIKDTFGLTTSATYVSFTTKEQSKPTMTSVSPANGAYNVPTSTSMTAKFDLDINPATLTPGNITVNGGTSLISGITNNTARQIQINFAALTPGTLYTVNFKNISSTLGGVMDEKSVSFYTAEQPNVIMNKDMESSTNIYEAGSGINTAGSGLSTDCAFTGNSSLKVEVTQDYGWVGYFPACEAGKTYNFSFAAKLKTNDLGTVFRQVMVAAAYVENGEMQYKVISKTPVMDIASTTFTQHSFDYTFTSTEQLKVYFYAENQLGVGTFYLDDFKVTEVSDTKLLPISSPMNNAQNVPLNTKINLIFNNSINPASVSGKVKINGSTALVGAVNTFTAEPNRLEVVLSGDLESNKTYEVTADGIIDSTGRTVNGIKTSFSTVNRYVVGNFNLYKDYTSNPVLLTGAALQTGIVTAVLDKVSNNSSIEGNVSLIVALYKGTSMAAVQYGNSAIVAHGMLAQPLTVSVDVPDLSDGNYYLKAYVWENMQNAQPIISSLKITE